MEFNKRVCVTHMDTHCRLNLPVRLSWTETGHLPSSLALTSLGADRWEETIVRSVGCQWGTYCSFHWWLPLSVPESERSAMKTTFSLGPGRLGRRTWHDKVLYQNLTFVKIPNVSYSSCLWRIMSLLILVYSPGFSRLPPRLPMSLLSLLSPTDFSVQETSGKI